MPLTREQFQRARDAGFSVDQIIQFEKRRNGEMNNTAPQNNTPAPKSIGGFIGNVGRSAVEFAGGVGQAVMHPIKTAQGIGGIALGGLEKLIPGEQGNEYKFNALANLYAQRYGGLENIGNTLYNDPIGAAGDIATVLGLGGGAISKVGKMANLEKLANLGRNLGETAVRIDPLSASLKAAGQGVEAITAGRKIAPFASKVDESVARAAKEINVDLPASAMSKSKVVPIIESTVAKGLFGGDITGKINKAAERLNTFSEDIIKKAGGSPDLSSAGLNISKGMEAYRNNFISIKNKLYEDAIPKVGMVKVNPTKSYNFLNSVLKDKQQAASVLGKSEDLGYFQNLVKRLEPRGEGGKFTERSIDGAVLRSAIKELNNKISNFSDPITTGNKGTLKKMVALLSDDLDSAIATQRPDMAQALSAANKFYSEGVGKLNSVYGEKISSFAKSGQYDKIVPAIINKNTSLEDIPKIMEVIGKENVNSLRSSFLDEFFKGARSGENFTPMGITKQIKSIGENKLSALLTPEQLSAIKNIEKVTQGMGRLDKVTGGSQTAFIGRIAGEFTTLGINPFKGALLLGGDALLSKFVASKAGKELLLSGWNLEDVGRKFANKAVNASNKLGYKASMVSGAGKTNE